MRSETESGFVSLVAETRNQTCEMMVIPQCSDLGYNHTTLSPKAQKNLLTNDILKSLTNVNTSLKRLVCAELVPPCFPESKGELYTACRSDCKLASTNSKSQFTNFFKSVEYCAALSNNSVANHGQFCKLTAWPKSGYWPSGLRWTLSGECKPLF